jgi:broad-specificity NMP kinase
MIKPDNINWEEMSIRLQAELVQERDLADRYKEKTQELEADIDKLTIVIEYLEVKQIGRAHV